MPAMRSFHNVARRFLLPAVLAFISFSFVVSPTTAFAQSPSSIITFDAPGAVATYPSGMNSSGVIVGTAVDSTNRSYGFLRTAGGTISIIRVPGAQNTTVYGINDAGTIVGSSDAGNAYFLRATNGKFTFFRPKGTQFLYVGTVDSLGNVAGTYLSTYDFFSCFVRTTDGTITTFNPPGGLECQTNDIAAGTVSGTIGGPSGYYSAFLRHPDGTYTDFQIGYQTMATEINTEGTAAGYFAESDGSTYGYVRTANGAVIYFGLPGATAIVADDINSGGTVTGNYATGSQSAYHGYWRSSDGSKEIFDAPGAGTGYLQGTFPSKINDAGNITGQVVDSNNVAHGFLLTP